MVTKHPMLSTIGKYIVRKLLYLRYGKVEKIRPPKCLKWFPYLPKEHQAMLWIGLSPWEMWRLFCWRLDSRLLIWSKS